MKQQVEDALTLMSRALDYAVRSAPEGQAIRTANDLAVAFHTIKSALEDCPCQDSEADGREEHEATGSAS